MPCNVIVRSILDNKGPVSYIIGVQHIYNKVPVSYLYQTVSLGVEELEDLLEVLHLVFSESLVLPRHIH